MPSESSLDAASRSPHDDVWLRFLVERMPAVLWSTDLDLRFTAGHGGALAVLGLRPNAMNGISLFEYFQTQDEAFPAIKAHRAAMAGHEQIFEQVWAGRVFESVLRPLRDRRGKIIGCVGMAFDITSRKQAEVSLQAKYDQLQDLFGHVPAMLYQFSGKLDGSTIEIPFLSQRGEEYFGRTFAEVQANPMLVLEAIHPEDRGGYYETALKAIRDFTQFEYEFRCVSSTGEIRWLRALSNPALLSDDKMIWHGVAVDITPRRKREQAQLLATEQMTTFVHDRTREILEANERLQREVQERKKIEDSLRRQTHLVNAILTQMPVVAFRINPHWELEEAQGAALQRLSTEGDGIAVYHALLDAPLARDGLAQALAGGQSRFTVQSEEADPEWAFDTFLAFDTTSQQGAIGFALDVTEHDQALRKLKRSEERARALADTSSDVILLINREGYITYINRIAEGADPSQVIGTHCTQWVPERCKLEVSERVLRVFTTGEFDEYEMEGYTGEGQIAWYATRIGPYRHEGDIQGVVMYVRDITQRKHAEQARAATEIRYQTLMDAAHDAIIVIDAASERVVDANSMAQQFLGMTAAEMAAQKHSELYAPQYREHVSRLFGQLADERQGLITDVELLEIRGHHRPVEVSLRWIDIEGNRLVIAIIRDVTERKRAEQTLRNEERLLRELLNLQERERRLIAYELHDGLVQDIAGAHFAMEGVAAQLQAGKSVSVAEIDSLRMLLSKAIDEGRRMISDLRPMIIDERGIVDAITYLVNEHQLQGGPEVEFTHQVAFERLSPLLEGTMFRIVQEALHNVQRHSQSERAEVELRQHEGRLRLVIRDQGIGFDPLQVPADRFGLRGMKERARLFGGQTTIRSELGQGTEVAVDLPIEVYLADGDGV